MWEVATGRCTQTLDGPAEAIEWLQWHPKGNVILAGSADFTAWMWLAQTGACMQVGFTPCSLVGGMHGRHSVHILGNGVTLMYSLRRIDLL